MYEPTALVIVVCIVIGYAPYLISEIFSKKGRCGLLSYTIPLFLLVGFSGLIGLVGGVAGPPYFWPEANQGPLQGIFITGPAGAIVGLLIFFLSMVLSGIIGLWYLNLHIKLFSQLFMSISAMLSAFLLVALLPYSLRSRFDRALFYRFFNALCPLYPNGGH